MVEYELPKLGVAGSNPVARSIVSPRPTGRWRTLWCAALLLVGGPAVAQDAPAATPWWLGLPVAGVQVVAGAGSLPDESLAPLLRTRQGDVLDPQTLRADLATLFQVGQFAAVEADVEPWVTPGPDGGFDEAVQVSLRVYPAPQVARMRVEGARRFPKRDLAAAAGVARGQVFYPDVEIPRVRSRVLSWLAGRGYPYGTVEVLVEPAGDALDVTVRVTEGEPNRVAAVYFAGDLDVVFPDGDTRPLTRWARQAGVAVGQPLAPAAVADAQQAIRTALASMAKPVWGERRGWIRARVTPSVVSLPEGKQVTFTVEPGAQLDLDIAGVRSVRRDRAVRQALGIDDRLRLTRGFLEDAPARLAAALAERGFLEATAEVRLVQEGPRRERLEVVVAQGPRHVLARGAWPNRVGAEISGNDAMSTADLQAVLEQASPEVLRRGVYTPEAMADGLTAAQDYYQAHGYQSAALSEGPVDIGWRRQGLWRALWAPVRAVTGAPPKRVVRPSLSVQEGPLTTLVAAEVVGAAPEVPLEALTAALQALTVGACTEARAAGCGAFSPQAIEQVARQVVDAHRAAGFLDADARVTHTPVPGTDDMRSTVAITPGSQILLRSVVTRGLRQVRPAFVRREVALRLGEPVTTPLLQRLRDDLDGLSAFRSVQLELLGDEAARDLVISARERAPWAFEAGAGLSTDQGTRLFSRVTRRNLWSVAHRVELYGQVGLDWLSESVLDWRPDLRNPDYRAALTYTAPRFPLRDEDLLVDVLLRERLAERTWRMARSGGGVALKHHLDFGLDLRLGVRLETRQLQEVDLGALLPGEPWAQMQAVDPSVPTQWRWQESAQGLVVLDRRDNPISPARGFVLQASGEYAPGLLDRWTVQPTVSFAKGGARVTGYLPLLGFTLRLTAEGGRAVGLDGGVVPLEDRYRLGGTNSLRGFARDTVGPRNLAPRVDVDFPSQIQPVLDYAVRGDATRWVPTGGDTMGLGVFELQMPWPALGLTAWDGWAAAVFADIGNAWLVASDTTATSNAADTASLLPVVRKGVGGGLRVATPIGPLQLDVATNLDAALSTGARRVLLVDGWEEPAVRAHLTLGALW